MLQRSIRFMVFFLLGIGVGVTALAIAAFSNIWKQKWQATYDIVEIDLKLPDTNTFATPNVPQNLTLVLYKKLSERLSLDHLGYVDVGYIPKRTRLKYIIPPKTSLTQMPEELLLPFIEVLHSLKSSTPVCPDVGTVFWDNCYGTFTAPWNVTYEGTWYGDKLDGFGRSINLKSGDTYIGQFVNNMYEGCGVFATKSGKVQQGLWRKNILQQKNQSCSLPKSN